MDCPKRAIFGARKGSAAEFCKTHKPADFVDVISKMCNVEGCVKQAVYGDLIERCVRVQLLDVGGAVNVCDVEACVKQAVYRQQTGNGHFNRQMREFRAAFQSSFMTNEGIACAAERRVHLQACRS